MDVSIEVDDEGIMTVYLGRGGACCHACTHPCMPVHAAAAALWQPACG